MPGMERQLCVIRMRCTGVADDTIKGYYIMEITPQEFMHLQSGISAKDVLIAKLQEELEQAKADRDMWKERAQAACADEGAVCVDHHRSEGVVVLSVELLKAILAKIHNLHILAVIALVLQRALHRGASAEERCSIAELVPLPKLPSISLTANGDIDVEGDWNDIHDNGNVKF